METTKETWRSTESDALLSVYLVTSQTCHVMLSHDLVCSPERIMELQVISKTTTHTHKPTLITGLREVLH